MNNPSRRNRNIGTKKQGHGQDNELRIPYHSKELKEFYEKLDHYKKDIRIINGHEFVFVIEKLRSNSEYACSINDIQRIIQHIPSSDYGDLKLIIFRQAKRKEEILSRVWGRLIYSFSFENDYHPAIILESIESNQILKWPRRLTIDDQKELNRLKDDGHEFIENKRYFISEIKPENARNTQLYRTLPHEFGHYVHYLNVVERPGNDDEDFDEWSARNDLFHKIPENEKETFAHNYAEKIKTKLIKDNIIPFDKL